MNALIGHARRAISIALLAIPTLSPAQEVAITWDDLPAHGPLPSGETRLSIINSIIATSKTKKLPPTYGFINARRLDSDVEGQLVLSAWRRAGLPLANHGWSHMNLNENSVAAFTTDISRNESTLKNYMGDRDWYWFRYPNLAEGNTPEKTTEVRAFLAARGYRIAGVTMSFGDYMWNEPYARCRAKGDSKAIAWLKTSFLAAAYDDIKVVHTRFSAPRRSRGIPPMRHVLLMHVGAFDSVMLPRLIDLYRSQGFRFVTLKRAQAHPYYRSYNNARLGPNKGEARPRPDDGLPARRSYAAALQAICH